MDSDYLQTGYAREKELKDLEDRLLILKEELIDMNEVAHGRPKKEIEDDIAAIEAKITLLKSPGQ